MGHLARGWRAGGYDAAGRRSEKVRVLPVKYGVWMLWKIKVKVKSGWNVCVDGVGVPCWKSHRHDERELVRGELRREEVDGEALSPEGAWVRFVWVGRVWKYRLYTRVAPVNCNMYVVLNRISRIAAGGGSGKSVCDGQTRMYPGKSRASIPACDVARGHGNDDNKKRLYSCGAKDRGWKRVCVEVLQARAGGSWGRASRATCT